MCFPGKILLIRLIPISLIERIKGLVEKPVSSPLTYKRLTPLLDRKVLLDNRLLIWLLTLLDRTVLNLGSRLILSQILGDNLRWSEQDHRLCVRFWREEPLRLGKGPHVFHLHPHPDHLGQLTAQLRYQIPLHFRDFFVL